MQSERKPEIGILLVDNFPDEIIENYKKELSAPNLNLQIHKAPLSGPYNSLEWTVPTLVCIYLSKSYFDGFLKEAGKDHYAILKKWLKKTSDNIRTIKVTVIAAEQSKEKLATNNTQSKVFSIQTKTNTEQHLKFLFDQNLSQENWNLAIEKLLKLLDEHFTNGITDELTVEIKNNNLEKSIYARLKSDTIDWEFLDIKKMVEEKMKK